MIQKKLLILLFLFCCFCLKSQGNRDLDRQLFYSIFDKDSKRVARCLEMGANINANYKYERYKNECRDWKPIQCAVAMDQKEILEILFSKGIDLHEKIKFSYRCHEEISLVHLAAWYGSNNALLYLLEKGLSVNQKNQSGIVPLYEAIKSGKRETVLMLIEKGADVNVLVRNCKDSISKNLLQLCIELDEIEILKILLGKGANPNLPSDGMSPLAWAIEKENFRAVYQLLIHGAERDVVHSNGMNAFQWAEIKGNYWVKQLIQQDLSKIRNNTLYSILEKGTMKRVKIFYRDLPDFSTKDLNGISFDLNELKGKTTLVCIWATWCIPCIKELREIQKMIDKNKEISLQVLAISIDNKEQRVKDFIAKNNLGFRFVQDPENLSRTAFNKNIPSSFILNEKGKWVAEMNGVMDWTQKEWKELFLLLNQ